MNASLLLGDTTLLERIDTIVEQHDFRLKRIKCAAMEGLVEEGKEVIEEIEKGPVRDAALIGGAQKVEHYEIASYGTLATMAKALGFADATTKPSPATKKTAAAQKK